MQFKHKMCSAAPTPPAIVYYQTIGTGQLIENSIWIEKFVFVFANFDGKLQLSHIE